MMMMMMMMMMMTMVVMMIMTVAVYICIVCLSVCLSVYRLSVYLSVYLSVHTCLLACLSVCPSCLSCMSVRLSVCLYLSVCLLVCRSVGRSVLLSVCLHVYVYVYAFVRAYRYGCILCVLCVACCFMVFHVFLSRERQTHPISIGHRCIRRAADLRHPSECPLDVRKSISTPFSTTIICMPHMHELDDRDAPTMHCCSLHERQQGRLPLGWRCALDIARRLPFGRVATQLFEHLDLQLLHELRDLCAKQ